MSSAEAGPLWELLAESDAAKAEWERTHTEHARLSWRHTWSIGLTCPGEGFMGPHAQPGDFTRCTPTVLNADRRDEDGELPDWLGYRGACLGCGWVGEPVERENAAAEDAHDHAWPGWRNVPAVPSPPGGGDYSLKDLAKRREAWLAKVRPLYPAGWLEAGGPIRTVRKPMATRHVPQRAWPGGGYDMACTEDEPRAGQQSLF